MSGKDLRYDAACIKVLEGVEAVRKRPGMYVGSTAERGLHQMVFEVVGRAVNAVLATGGGRVDVTLTPDGGVLVADDGPGVPFEGDADADGPGLEALLTGFPAGPGPAGRHVADVGYFHVGLMVANALSSRLTAEVRCEGVRRAQEYARGVALTPPVAVGSTTTTGTTIAFWPDTEIFETTRCSFAVLAERLRQVAFLSRGLEISLADRRPDGGARKVRFCFPDGVRDFVAALHAETGGAVAADVVAFEREDPRMAGAMEVALVWQGSGEDRVRGFANSRPTFEGGAHLDGFRDGLATAVTAYGRARGLLTAVAADVGADGIWDGVTAVVSVKLDHPEFLGATRTLLGGTEVRACVREAVRDHVGTWLDAHPEDAARIVDRINRSADRD
ncbi:DNA gyrase subunit B [Streptomyces sp. P3]|uniref:ATP-binding protein n=1 Tax=Streptomyces sp. P3 TaxID=2135430 RepID=UPI000D1B83E0|nr:ATP-binding protein [Streptomyces sp. P3]AVV44525.1 DNA gyrase subunit B [Streptomyces sp. P3]